jgi:hypothetical protein
MAPQQQERQQSVNRGGEDCLFNGKLKLMLIAMDTPGALLLKGAGRIGIWDEESLGWVRKI